MKYHLLKGKEMETKLKEKKPGNLTDDLRISLGMPVGASADKVPPPWLIAMQRYGPPPSYPSLKIPGLNAPIPEGCSFGYHAGGWGKPPVDEFGRPLYGDVFGTSLSDIRKPEEEEPVDQSLWGQMEDEVYEEVMPEEEEEEEEDEESEAGKEGEQGNENMDSAEDTATGLKTPGEGLMTPSGISTTVSAGLETPDMIELRKRKTQIESDMESLGTETPALYKILPEKSTNVGTAIMGSSKLYDLASAKKATPYSDPMSGTVSGINMIINPEDLDIGTESLQSKIEERMKGAEKEEANKQKKKKTQPPPPPTSTSSSSDKDKNKKHKEFKF